ncbi:tetratricopeptide repeat protein [Phormidium tenue FACHB-886]|nr:tetratricopeptide repeat protein [Phormidium tenue FACHB-886]
MTSSAAELRSYADGCFAQGQYAEAAAAYEEAIALEPEESSYWWLGLSLFLQGEQADAQLAWMTPLLEATSEETARSHLLKFLLEQAQALNHAGYYEEAVQLGLICIELAPDDPNVLLPAANWMQHTDDPSWLLESIALAETGLARSSSLIDQVLFTHLSLSALMSTCGEWQHSWKSYQIHKQLLASLGAGAEVADRNRLPNLLGMGAFLLYFEDNPKINRPIRSQFAAVCQAELQQQVATQRGQRYHQTYAPLGGSVNRPLKIGYLSECLRQHSIGWLIRWLLKYHDRHRFDVHLYSLMPAEDWLQNSFRAAYGDRFQTLPPTAVEIADRIYQDKIDILVELDSLTSLSGCGAVALKPAPIQVNWLGYDASGIPGVDYFIADPYVLPEAAQSYYQEKIWRLPQTYIAVEGFEAHTPSLRRDQLGIPADAIAYLSSQSGLKRNPDNVRLQLRILKEVPHSYFLIKSWRASLERLESFFGQLADAEGVSRDRLCFLPGVASEFTHRANLGLADVVLDTYPYNGATTTLEALWMGLPIVTRVGEQFAARNSYTMMQNVGLSEGIAWTDEEYVEWGVRLGQDATLREEIGYRLRRSRHTSPLWNAKVFTQQMETAFEQMWKNLS